MCRLSEGICSLRPDGVKGAAVSGALVHSGRGEGRVQMWCEPVPAEAGMTLQQPEAPCILPGKLSLDHGTLAVAGCTGSQEGRCGECPVLAHRLLGGGSSSLSISCPSLGSALIAVARACLWSSFRRRSESPLLTHQEIKRQEKVSCLFGSCRLFPGLPPS